MGGGVGERKTKSLIHHTCHLLCHWPPTKSWLCACSGTGRYRTPAFRVQLALPTTLLCVSSTSLSHWFSCLLKATRF